MTYEKEIIVPSTAVAGNIKDYKQTYEIKFYPETAELKSKIALYIYLESGEATKYAKRSIYFSSTEQLRELIFNLTKAYFYFRDKRVEPKIPREEFRILDLDNLLYKLRKKQIDIWKNAANRQYP